VVRENRSLWLLEVGSTTAVAQPHFQSLGARFMTDKRARHYAKVLARGMGVTFYVVRSRQGRFLAVQIPSDDCQILATVMPPRTVRMTRQFRRDQVRGAA
jgi:hypothetical protein